MKKTIKKRTKRMKNGTTTWKLTIMNTKTGAVCSRTVRGTYDELTTKVHHIRSHNTYNAVCAEEMHKWGGRILEKGRVVALDSIEDEKMLEESLKKKLSQDDDDDFDENELEFT